MSQGPGHRLTPSHSRKRQATHLSRARRKQGIGCRAKSGTCRVDVVDEQDATLAAYVGARFEASSQVRHTLRTCELALVARPGTRKPINQHDSCSLGQRPGNELGVVEPSSAICCFRGRNIRDAIENPVRRHDAKHHRCHSGCEPTLSLVFKNANDFTRMRREHGGARTSCERQLGTSDKPKRNGIARSALHVTICSATSPASAPPVEIRQRSSAPVAKHLAEHIADRASRRPKGFGNNLPREFGKRFDSFVERSHAADASNEIHRRNRKPGRKRSLPHPACPGHTR